MFFAQNVNFTLCAIFFIAQLAKSAKCVLYLYCSKTVRHKYTSRTEKTATNDTYQTTLQPFTLPVH